MFLSLLPSHLSPVTRDCVHVPPFIPKYCQTSIHSPCCVHITRARAIMSDREKAMGNKDDDENDEDEGDDDVCVIE